ncbi:hypothetical protein EDC96DRAFT_452717 [Choanephora cucurbitarum]|nr:hypothetical protein EDC96DRAFT_452717 [Choanephora cucurbitarum]
MGIVGTLRFLGEAEFKEGYWAGIQLDIVGSGKNDGSVKGIRYFSCPPQTGLFVLASKITPLDSDSDSVRSLSPPVQVPQSTNSANKLSLITNGSRAARYVGMTATQLTQQQQQQQQSSKRKTRTPSLSVRSSTSSIQTPITSPVSVNPSSTRSNFRRSQSMVQSPTPTHYNRGIPSPAMTPTSHSVHDNPDDYYTMLSSDEMLMNETPIPDHMAMSKSITTHEDAPNHGHTDASGESPHERLERVLGEAISQAPDETVMRLQQLQLRVEVLEAENKFLKLENTQNKTAEQILERSLVLNKKGNGEEELFTLEGHKAVVEELKEKHAAEIKTIATQQQETLQAIQRLETRVQELEAEQQQLITERDKSLFDISTIRKEKSVVEHRVHELENKIAEAEAATAAAQAGEKLLLEKTKTLQQQLSAAASAANDYNPQQYFQPGSAEENQDFMERQMKLEMEMEEVHEKMSSLRDAARAKDMFLTALTEQVEQHRNAVEEKERELRRVKADAERHTREKERLLEELKEIETKWLAHQDCASKEAFDKIKKELATVKESYAKESARVKELEKTVDELKLAGMESIELYESSVEMNRVDREAINASLADERRKVASLELEREDLRKAGLDAIEFYESAMAEIKKERALQLEEHTMKREAMQSTIDTLKQEIDQLMKNVETEEKHNIVKDVWENERKRLTEQIEMLEREKANHEAFKSEAEAWKEQSKETEKLLKEKTKLEEQLGRLQADFDEQLAARTKYLDEIRAAVESQKKTEGELRRLTEAKDKLERELTDKSTNASSVVNEKQHQLEIETFQSEIEKLKAQNAMLLKQKEQAEQGQQNNMQYQQLVASLKAENSKLQESHKQTETELLKLMEEVEKLHQQASQDDSTKLILKDESLSEDDKIAQIVQQHQKKMEQLAIEHATELRKAKESSESTEKESKRQVALLNRDISELESLIESKIFKEADLEEALETERKQVKKLMQEIQDLKEDTKLRESLSSSFKKEQTKKEVNHQVSDLYCEICEVPGHDLISCKAVSVTKESEL